MIISVILSMFFATRIYGSTNFFAYLNRRLGDSPNLFYVFIILAAIITRHMKLSWTLYRILYNIFLQRERTEVVQIFNGSAICHYIRFVLRLVFLRSYCESKMRTFFILVFSISSSFSFLLLDLFISLQQYLLRFFLITCY